MVKSAATKRVPGSGGLEMLEGVAGSMTLIRAIEYLSPERSVTGSVPVWTTGGIVVGGMVSAGGSPMEGLGALALASWVGGTDKGKSARQVELGDRIRRQRERLGLSQEALAHEASINRTYIA
jgi:hypothetical protein